MRLRADGSDEVAGIRPDLSVLEMSGESGLARAARLIKVFAEEVGARPPGGARQQIR